MAYKVNTQFFYNDKWMSASDTKTVGTLEAAHDKGRELVKDQRRDFVSGIVKIENNPVPRRYVIAEIVFTSDPL
jgi:hypothetical protein